MWFRVRDFLDRLVTSTIALEGDGTAIEYAGGYSDYVDQRGPRIEATGVTPSRARWWLPRLVLGSAFWRRSSGICHLFTDRSRSAKWRFRCWTHARERRRPLENYFGVTATRAAGKRFVSC